MGFHNFVVINKIHSLKKITVADGTIIRFIRMKKLLDIAV